MARPTSLCAHSREQCSFLPAECYWHCLFPLPQLRDRKLVKSPKNQNFKSFFFGLNDFIIFFLFFLFDSCGLIGSPWPFSLIGHWQLDESSSARAATPKCLFHLVAIIAVINRPSHVIGHVIGDWLPALTRISNEFNQSANFLYFLKNLVYHYWRSLVVSVTASNRNGPGSNLTTNNIFLYFNSINSNIKRFDSLR